MVMDTVLLYELLDFTLAREVDVHNNVILTTYSTSAMPSSAVLGAFSSTLRQSEM